MIPMEENELVPVAMQIIIHAGSARSKCEKAIKSAKAMDFVGARMLMGDAKADILEAHKSQTEVIQNEADGKAYEPCFLFTHAQDTLMTIKSEVTLTQSIIELFEMAINANKQQV